MSNESVGRDVNGTSVNHMAHVLDAVIGIDVEKT